MRRVVHGGLSPARYTLDITQHGSARCSSKAQAAKPQPAPSEACRQLTIDSGNVGWDARTTNIPGFTHTENESGCKPLLEANHQAPRYPKWQAKGYTAAAGGG